MGSSLVGGAVVGAVFGRLMKSVLEVKGKATEFKKAIEYLEITLTAITPVITEIVKHNSELGRPKEELESLIKKMEEAKKLVYKCSKIHRLNIRARLQYKEQLVELVGFVTRFFMIDLQAQTARDLKETLPRSVRISSAVNNPVSSRTQDSTPPRSTTEPVD